MDRNASGGMDGMDGWQTLCVACRCLAAVECSYHRGQPVAGCFYFFPIVFCCYGTFQKICLLAYLFLITLVIYKYVLVIKYSNKKEVCKVKNKLFLPVLFPSPGVITVINLVCTFSELSL